MKETPPPPHPPTPSNQWALDPFPPLNPSTPSACLHTNMLTHKSHKFVSFAFHFWQFTCFFKVVNLGQKLLFMTRKFPEHTRCVLQAEKCRIFTTQNTHYTEPCVHPTLSDPCSNGNPTHLSPSEPGFACLLVCLVGRRESKDTSVGDSTVVSDAI